MSAQALVLIDFQRGFDAPIWGARNNPDAEAQARALLDHWRAYRAPVIHIRHQSLTEGSPLAAGSTGSAFKPELTPIAGEAVFEKSVNSAFIGTGLEAHLRAAGIDRLVICGLTTPHCVSTSARMGANLGFDVTLAHDACAAFATNARLDWAESSLPPLSAQAIHEAAVAHLHGEFVTATATATLLRSAP